MRLDVLKERVRTSVCLSGRFKVFIIFRGEEYFCYSKNIDAYYRLWSDVTYNTRIYGLTYKQALRLLYDECKRANFLGEFNNFL